MKDVSADYSRLLLAEPIPGMGLAYDEFLQEFVAAGEEGILHHLPEGDEDAADLIRRLINRSKGIDLPDGWVPCTAYWLMSGNGALLGEIHIRHRLTPALEDYGGHIGYMVRPTQRRKGYATKMLALALEKAGELGLARVMITCDPANIASASVIQRNGGILLDESVAGAGRLTSRYWIDLRQSVNAL